MNVNRTVAYIDVPGK